MTTAWVRSTIGMIELDLPLTAGGGGGDVDAHLADPIDAHDASAVSFVPTGTIAATNVQDAIVEVAAEAGGVAPSEVEIGASDPIGVNAAAELWYDTDATGATVSVVSGSYTPTLTGIVVGTGGTPYNTAKYVIVGGVIHVEGRIQFGNTANTYPSGANPGVSLPAGVTFTNFTVGQTLPAVINYLDTGVGNWIGTLWQFTSTSVIFVVYAAAAAYVNIAVPAATVPFAWGAGDQIIYSFTAQVTGP